MISYVLRAFCGVACVACAWGQRVTDFTTALDRAKSSKSPIAVFIRGSDWNRPGEIAAKTWNDPRFLSGLGSGILLVDLDRKENPNDAEKELLKLNEKGNPQVRSIPAIALYDSEGRLIGLYSGSDEIAREGGIFAATKKLLQILRERDEFWRSAKGSSGVMKAGRLGQGLDRMDMGLGPKGIYQPIFDEMKKADPDDKSGYLGKYTFSAESLLDITLDGAKKGEFAGLEEKFAKLDANPRLSARQRQLVEAARFALYQNWPDRKSLMKPTLEKMRDIDPKSQLGQAAENYLELMEVARRKGGAST
ncbi:MAG: hypothetical protein RLZZ245_235 [Verrucomicrobiota bacterium]